MSFENRNYAFAGAFIDELARCGLRHVCICPGSRSSPLAISFARHPGIRKWVHLDERSAAFFALGMARYLNEPVALVCTSGTAVANFLPALVEARYSSVPLLVLTADRPPELVDWGALQTIDQTRLYGCYVKWSANMPPPDVTLPLMGFVRSIAGRALATATEEPKGAVHLNFPFRDPLEPAAVPSDLPDSEVNLQNQIYQGRPEGRPFLRSVSVEKRPLLDDIQRLASELTSIEHGLIICGPATDTTLAVKVVTLARQLGYPVLADCLSQVRCGPHDRSSIIDCYDSFIGDGELTASLAPQVVLRFGALPVSKSLTGYLEQCSSARHILVDDMGWRDPFHITSEIWHIGAVPFCETLSSFLKSRRVDGEWSNRWHTLAETTRSTIRREFARIGEMFEGKVFAELVSLRPSDSLLFAGNSMPVRDMDTFVLSTELPVRFMANRGASGIDGVVSTALGASAVSSGRLVLVVGDISFYHDMNGLLAAKNCGLNATIVVINNNGSGIFSFLPQASYEDVFEHYFATPHDLTFRAAADLYGLHYCFAQDWETYIEAVKVSLAGTGTTIIEVPGERKLNVRLHRQIRDAIVVQIRRNERANNG